MNEYNLKKLQNGSDIRGISLTGVGGSGVPNLRDAREFDTLKAEKQL